MSVNDSYDKINDETIITEIANLIRTRSGRIDHPEGGHDDTCISWLFARWFLMYGEHIDRYLDPLIIGTLCDIKGKTDEETERLRKEKETEIRRKIAKENEEMMAPFRNSNNIIDPNSIGGYVPSVQEQNDIIRSGRLDKIPSGDLENVFGNMSEALIERYDPDPKTLSKNAKMLASSNVVDHDKGKLLTLDPSEMEDDDSLESEEIYNKNPKDIDFSKKTKVIDSNEQFERQMQADAHSSDFNKELSWFMKQFNF
jgi:hypothetical protein